MNFVSQIYAINVYHYLIIANALCSTTTETSHVSTDIIVKSTLTEPTTVPASRSTMKSTMNDPSRSTARSSIITAVSYNNTVTSSTKIFSTVTARVRTKTMTAVFSKTQSSTYIVTVNSASKSVPSSSVGIISQTKRSSQGELPTVVSSNSIQMSNEPQTYSQDPSSSIISRTTSNTPPPISTTAAVTTGTTSPIEGNGLSGYIIATVVSSAGFSVVCLILIGITLYAFCLRKRRNSNPVATEQTLSFTRRPQSQTSLYSNGAYLMNKLKKKEFIPTASNSSPSHHHYDTPTFTESKESDETENRYSTLNRLSQFNRNPAYSISSRCTLTMNDDNDNSHDYEEV